MPHLHDKIDFTVTAYVVHNGAVLLRLHEKYGKWLAPGGHIELDEDPIEAVIRELKEETGLAITLLGDDLKQFDDGTSDLPSPLFLNRHRINETHEHVDLIYAAHADTNQLNPAAGEMASAEDFRWFTSDELEAAADVTPRVKQYAQAALKKAQAL